MCYFPTRKSYRIHFRENSIIIIFICISYTFRYFRDRFIDFINSETPIIRQYSYS